MRLLPMSIADTLVGTLLREFVLCSSTGLARIQTNVLVRQLLASSMFVYICTACTLHMFRLQR
jgi:hypothetical protein